MELKTLAQAIPIPLNATNGEVMKAVFPKAKIFEIESDKTGKVISYGIWLDDNQYYFDREWWDSPYGESNPAFK